MFLVVVVVSVGRSYTINYVLWMFSRVMTRSVVSTHYPTTLRRMHDLNSFDHSNSQRVILSNHEWTACIQFVVHLLFVYTIICTTIFSLRLTRVHGVREKLYHLVENVHIFSTIVHRSNTNFFVVVYSLVYHTMYLLVDDFNSFVIPVQIVQFTLSLYPVCIFFVSFTNVVVNSRSFQSVYLTIESCERRKKKKTSGSWKWILLEQYLRYCKEFLEASGKKQSKGCSRKCTKIKCIYLCRNEVRYFI